MLRRHWLVGIFCASLGISVGCEGNFESAGVNDPNANSDRRLPEPPGFSVEVFGGISSRAPVASREAARGRRAPPAPGTGGTAVTATGGSTGGAAGAPPAPGTGGTIVTATGGSTGGAAGLPRPRELVAPPW